MIVDYSSTELLSKIRTMGLLVLMVLMVLMGSIFILVVMQEELGVPADGVGEHDDDRE